MRIVLDTNLLARAATPGRGMAREIVRLALSPPNVLVASPDLVIELSRVLRYNRIRGMHGMDDAAINHHLKQLVDAAELVAPPSGIAIGAVPSDADDEMILACAAVGRADVLCTLDKHFQAPEALKFCLNHGVRVVSDRELLELLRSPPEAGP